MTQVEKKIEWCLRKAEQESQKHKGLKKVPINNEKVYIVTPCFHIVTISYNGIFN